MKYYLQTNKHLMLLNFAAITHETLVPIQRVAK